MRTVPPMWSAGRNPLSIQLRTVCWFSFRIVATFGHRHEVVAGLRHMPTRPNSRRPSADTALERETGPGAEGPGVVARAPAGIGHAFATLTA